MVLLAAFAGLRRGVCLGLARRHLGLDASPPTVRIERPLLLTQDDGGLMQQPKTVAGNRTLPSPAAVAEVLREHLDTYVAPGRDALLFTAEETGSLRARTGSGGSGPWHAAGQTWIAPSSTFAMSPAP